MPSEIQDYIVHLATFQYIRDNQKNELWNNVCNEILQYGTLKKAWGLGYIKKKKGQWRHYANGNLVTIVKRPVTLVYGYFIDHYGEKRVHYLGSPTLGEALSYDKHFYHLIYPNGW